MTTLTPFRLRPWFRPMVWGVRDLAPWYDYKISDQPIGEVWLSGNDCVVDTGVLAGKTLDAVFHERREELLGESGAHQERFPLLMKVLFPREKLSVQVHPGDEMARQHGEPHGKTECWYVLEADPGATVALGLRPGTSLPDVKAAIENHTLENLLQSVPVNKDEMIFVDAGTVHAIFPGVVMLETQQNSDMTYRLYDYGRPRELHLKDGLQAIRLEDRSGPGRAENRAGKRLAIACGRPRDPGAVEIFSRRSHSAGRWNDGELFTPCREEIEHSPVGICRRGGRPAEVKRTSAHSAAAWRISGRAGLQP